MNEYSKQQLRSGQIPAFGNWDEVKELPITQYFENARQAGLKTSHSRELNYVAAQSKIHHHPPNLPSKKKKNTTSKTFPRIQEHEKRVHEKRVHEKQVDKFPYTATHKHNQVQKQSITSGVISASHRKLQPTIKPMDEDLYKIPSEILHNSKRKKFFGFFSRCFVPHTIY